MIATTTPMHAATAGRLRVPARMRRAAGGSRPAEPAVGPIAPERRWSAPLTAAASVDARLGRERARWARLVDGWAAGDRELARLARDVRRCELSSRRRRL